MSDLFDLLVPLFYINFVLAKGQLISKCPFGVFKFFQKTKQIDLRYHSSQVKFFHLSYVFPGHNDSVQRGLTVIL